MRAEVFLNRQKKSKVSSLQTSKIESPIPVGIQLRTDAPKPRPVVSERPVPAFTCSDMGVSVPSRRKWPMVVCGVIGGLILLGIVGKSIVLSNGESLAALTNNSRGGISENAKAEIKRYFNVTSDDGLRWFMQIRMSPHIVDNVQYAAVVEKVKFYYKQDDSEVNAYAGVGKADGKPVRFVCLCGGAVLFSRLASLAVASQQLRKDGSCTRFLRAIRASDCGRMDEDRAVALIERVGLRSALGSVEVITRARSISAGMLMGMLAHEVGHHALGHTVGQAQNLEIARNQEREADSFASSIIQANDFGEHILEGSLIWWYALAQQESVNGETTSHPASRERYQNFIRSNAAMAHMLGFTN